MAANAEDQPLRERISRIDALLRKIEQSKDPEAAAQTREVVQALMELHGAGLERILAMLAATGPKGLELIDSLGQDDLVASLMLLYGLHPLDLESRVKQALEKTRPFLKSHGGNVELLSLVGGVVRLRLQGSCQSCPSSAVTLKQTIEEAIYEKAPDITAIMVEEEPGHEAALEVGGACESSLLDESGNRRVALPILSH